MKISLSRKGFDSANGMGPSPILPDGRLISLPIPSHPFDDNQLYCDLSLRDYSGSTYLNMMKELGYDHLKIEKEANDRIIVKLDEPTENLTCHLDPDLIFDTLERQIGWRPLFGQTGIPEKHLHNQEFTEGDLFLFYGWFRQTIYNEEKLQFSNDDPFGKHIIFGYMQIGEIMRKPKESDFKPWMKYHAHALDDRVKDEENTIYVAREKLTWNENIQGAGTFKYHDDLVLTANGQIKSVWRLPHFFSQIPIGVSWNPKGYRNGYFYSSHRGQEFVIPEKGDRTPEKTKLVEEWAKRLINNHHLN